MDFYNLNAKDFSRTRYKIWNSVKSFLNSIDENSLILDAGCGNGKNMLETKHNFIGLDNSIQLLNIVKTKTNNNLILGSITDIPFTDNYFDAIICIAVIHHIQLEKDRYKAIDELIRVCKIGGKILITVWQLENNNVYNNGIKLENKNDRLIKWGKNSFRYYHFFDREEIDKIIERYNYSIRFLEEKNNYYIEIIKIEKK